MREFTCKECGVIFKTTANRDRLYCSKSCKAKYEIDNKKLTMFKEIKYNKDEITGCWNCTSHTGNRGYPMVKRDGKRIYLSRFMYINNVGEIPDSMQIRHKCDNPSCINPDHLEIGTIADNMHDKVERGRQQRGSQMPCSKLIESDVVEIRKSKMKRKELASMYNVSLPTIDQIIQGKTWKHVKINMD